MDSMFEKIAQEAFNDEIEKISMSLARKAGALANRERITIQKAMERLGGGSGKKVIAKVQKRDSYRVVERQRGLNPDTGSKLG